jgi:accessory colonization factor AcfC
MSASSSRFRNVVAALSAGLLLPAAPAGATTGGVLRAYGPGGPHHVLQECADLFEQKHGVAVEIVRALPGELAEKLREDGDLYFGGAEFMLEEFARENPGVLDMASAEKLHPRRVGVLVRKGNPLDIKGLDCLQRDGVDILAVKLENMTQLHEPGRHTRSNVRRRVYTGQDGVREWRSSPELDAWVTYESWHVSLEEESDFVEIPGDHARRFTVMALTDRTPNRQAALHFMGFLKSPEARSLFVEHGWE